MHPQSHFTVVAGSIPQYRPESLRVAVIGGDPLARKGLIALLGEYDDLDAFEIEHLHRAVASDVVLCDGTAGDVRHLDRPSLALVRDRAEAADAIAAGARGALLRSASPKRLHAAIRAVAEGLVVVDDDFADELLQHPKANGDELLDPLTVREQEVMQLLAVGLTNKEIAHRLGISDHTVKFHVNGILGKLGVESRTEAVVQAARLGIVVL